MDSAVYSLAVNLGNRLKSLNWQLALAESCTGGAIAQAVTDVPGSSAWFDRGFVTYSNAAKLEMLGVKQTTLDDFGAVSQETALEMVAGTLAHSHANLALAVTGIAGPDGGSAEKPIGTVFISWQCRGHSGVCVKQCFSGDRLAIRRQVVGFCLYKLTTLAETGS